MFFISKSCFWSLISPHFVKSILYLLYRCIVLLSLRILITISLKFTLFPALFLLLLIFFLPSFFFFDFFFFKYQKLSLEMWWFSAYISQLIFKGKALRMESYIDGSGWLHYMANKQPADFSFGNPNISVVRSFLWVCVEGLVPLPYHAEFWIW